MIIQVFGDVDDLCSAVLIIPKNNPAVISFVVLPNIFNINGTDCHFKGEKFNYKFEKSTIGQ